MVRTSSLLGIAMSLAMASAECDATGASPPPGTKETDSALCMVRGAGQYTFGMTASADSTGIQRRG